MKKITLNAIVDNEGNIIIQYKLGNWVFAWYSNNTMNTWFRMPKYCGSTDTHFTVEVQSKPLTIREAFAWYKNQRVLFMDSIVEDRLNYYQQKFDSILTEHRRLNTV